jgi:hypothetical protein
MEWLKKHWKILAAIAVGIPVLYWLYETYLSNSAPSNDNSGLQAQEQADETAYAQQVAVASLDSGSSSGSSGSSTQANNTVPETASTSNGTNNTVSISTSTVAVNPDATAPPGQGFAYGNPYAPGSNEYNSYQQELAHPGTPIPVGENTNPEYAPGSPQAAVTQTTMASTAGNALSTLFGGGSSNDTALVAQTATVSAPEISHIASGAMPQHLQLAATPTSVEMSSLGGRI